MEPAVEQELAIWPSRATLAQPFAIAPAISWLLMRTLLGATLTAVQLDNADRLLALVKTTVAALVWAVHLLSEQPVFQQRVRQEVHNLLGHRRPSIGELAQLTYTALVCQEALRYSSAVWPPTDAVLSPGGINDSLPILQLIAARQQVIHQHPALLLPDHGAAGSPLVAQPFCVGHKLALLASQLVLAMIMQRFALTAPNAALLLDPPYDRRVALERIDQT
mgnify:FL=1